MISSRPQPQLAERPVGGEADRAGGDPAAAGARRDPVADLGDALVAADVLDRDAGDHLVVPRRPRASRSAVPAVSSSSRRRPRPARPRACRARHARPARDRRVLADRHERVDVARRFARSVITPSLRGGSGWRSTPLSVPPASMARRVTPRVLDLGSPCSLWAQALYGPFLRAPAARPRGPATTPPPEGARPRVSLIVAAYREEEVIAAKVANALALDWPRDALEVIVAVDGGADAGADRTAELARGAGADQRARAAARRQGTGPGCRRAGRLRRSAGVRRRQRHLGPRRARAARSALRRPAGRLRVRARAVRLRRRHQPGGRLLALRAVAARAGVGARVGDRRATARSTRCARPPTSRSTR